MEKNIMVILCGSLIPVMKSQTLDYSSPLYGRRTGDIKLTQLSYMNVKEMFPDRKDEELILAYGVFGGCPSYLKLYQDYTNVYDAINNLIFSSGSFLPNEPIFLLQGELREISLYSEILSTISLGNHKLASICNALGKRPNDLCKPLWTLTQLDIIEREVPVTAENKETSKKGMYKIRDNFINFWFNYCFTLGPDPNIDPDSRLEKIKEPFLTNYIPFIYERICLQKMQYFNSHKMLPINFNSFGRYWDSNCEIDIVGLGDNSNQVILGECKYTKNPIDISNYKDLLVKERFFLTENSRYEVNYYILFSLSGFTDELLEYSKTKNNIILVKCLDIIS